MTPPVPTTPADTSALVQHFLLYHGARYTSRASEESWKHVPVALAAPEIHMPAGQLAAGSWLVLPWDAPTLEGLEAWLLRLRAAGPMPHYVVVVMAQASLPPDGLQRLAAEFATQLVAVSSSDSRMFGSPAAEVLEGLYQPQQLHVLETVNPLEHLSALGDPRNPEVFFERLRRAGRGSPMTLLLIGLNLLVFVAMTAFRDGSGNFFATFDPDILRSAGANVASATVGEGQAWRLLTCTFVHANVLHVGMNMYVLKSVGETAERLFGSVLFFVLYILAGLGGSIASLAWTLSSDPRMPSVGASGAVFGVMGGLLGFALSRRNSVPAPVYKSLLRISVFFTAVNIGLGMMVPQIDNAAHIGGLLVGFVAGTVLSRDLPPAPQPSATQRVVVIAVCFGVLGLAYQFAAQFVRM